MLTKIKFSLRSKGGALSFRNAHEFFRDPNQKEEPVVTPSKVFSAVNSSVSISDSDDQVNGVNGHSYLRKMSSRVVTKPESGLLFGKKFNTVNRKQTYNMGFIDKTPLFFQPQ